MVPLRAKTTMNYTDYGGSGPNPQGVTRGGGQLRTPKLSLVDAGGGGASSDIVTTFALFLILRLPLAIVLHWVSISFETTTSERREKRTDQILFDKIIWEKIDVKLNNFL